LSGFAIGFSWLKLGSKVCQRAKFITVVRIWGFAIGFVFCSGNESKVILDNILSLIKVLLC
jgi:hypothetical protein